MKKEAAAPVEPAQAAIKNGASTCTDSPTPVQRWSSSTLFLGAQELEIEHHGVVYRLRRTSLGKLILTK
jgi:hemin uptake protein HemP